MDLQRLLLFLLIPLFGLTQANTIPISDTQLASFLKEVNQNLTGLYRTQQQLEHFLEVYGSDSSAAPLHDLSIVEDKIYTYFRSLRAALIKFKRAAISDDDLIHQLNALPDLNYAVLSLDDSKRISEAIDNLEKYKNTLRDYCGLSELKGGAEEADKLKNCWEKKSDELRHLVKEDWKTWLELEKKTANFHGFVSPSDFWLRNLDMKSEESLKMASKFLTELWPLFEQFHAFIRAKLREKYGLDKVPSNEPIPYHLYDSYVYNNWDQIDYPYAEEPRRHIAEGLKKRGLNSPKRLFHNVAEFYRSLGFHHLNHEFWSNNSQLSQQTENCTTKVWNFFEPDRVQLTYCKAITEKHFFEMFEALLEVHFFNSVQHLPAVFQIEPFPQFIEAVGGAFALNAASAKYLEKLKILDEGDENEETSINFLYEMGFRTLLPLPMLYVLERVRTMALDSKLDSNANCFYWELVEEHVGVQPPANRSNRDFDFGEKIVIDVQNEYVSSIMSLILKFQVFQHMCESSNQYVRNDPQKPLHLCDLSNQASIGPEILKGLALGASKSYRTVLKEITGQTEISTDGIIEYFKPLYVWLQEQNDLNNVAIGWQRTSVCSNE